ncbi:MAG TPA: endonuclease/exonuclease/phosphatase family protein, partial [Candidatus Obscuribacterales bacterium]
SLFFYMATRVSQAGVPLLLSSPQKLGLTAWGTLGVFVLAGIFLPQRRTAAPEVQPLPASAGSLGLVFGLLTGLSLGLATNLHLWSAQTDPVPDAAYFLPLAIGALTGWLAYRHGQAQRLLLIGAATCALGAALVPLLYTGYDLLLGQLACTGAAAGIFTLWAFFLGRWRAYLRQDPEFFPWLGLQGGFVGLLLILAVFLLKANPGGFWLALLGAGGLLLWHELRNPSQELGGTVLDRLWQYSCGVFALMGLGVLLLPVPAIQAQPPAGPITVMTSNIRYGWTDDYRFDPFLHPRWLKTRLPAIMGLEEVNKGHTSGAYSDLFRLYQKLLPGRWLYGDAHFGFGNALFTRYEVLGHEVRTYQARDMLKRSCLITTLRIENQPVDVFVTHLSHLDPPNPVREAQAAELAGWLGQSRHPWILLGDFNATPDSAEIQLIEKLAHPLFRSQPKLLQINSFPAIKPTRRIDYIFFSSEFSLKKMNVLDNGGTTDHRPVYAELELKKK